MKKLFIICFVAFALQCTAQDILPFTWGPIAGMSSTKLNTDIDLKDHVSGSGYNIGGFARLKVLFLYAEAEVTYGSKSVSVTLGEDTTNSTIVFRLNGVDASAILGMKLLGLGENANLRLFAGYNWNNYSDATFSVNGQELNVDNINSNNSSVLAGIGCDVWKLAVNLKYIHGLSDIASSSFTEAKTMVVNLSVAYKFK